MRHWYELWYQCHGEKYGKQASGGGDVSLVASKHNKKAWMVILIDNSAICLVNLLTKTTKLPAKLDPNEKKFHYYAHTGLRFHRVTFWSACTLQILKNPCVRFTGTRHSHTHTSVRHPIPPESKKFMLYYPIKYEMRFISSHLKFKVTAHAF